MAKEEFEEGKLSLKDLRAYVIENGEPAVQSDKQEYPENMITDIFNYSIRR